jgi:hypothetical protein
MPSDAKSVRPSLREILADSHIAAVSIAVLLTWSLESGLLAVWHPLRSAAGFVFMAIAILDIPYDTLTGADRIMLIGAFTYLFHAFLYLVAAWVLCRWVYGLGLLPTLSKLRNTLARRDNV